MLKTRQREKVANVLREVATTLGNLGQDVSATRLLNRAAYLERGTLQVNFIGDSGRGKTTLIRALQENRLLHDDMILVDTPGSEKSAQSLANADVLVMLLGSRPLFTQTDVDIIRSQLQGFDTSHVEHLFFVINDFGLTFEEKKQILEERAPQQLGTLFGGDAALFSRRVFCIDAKAALAAKTSGAEDAVFAETGLLPFEHTLQHLLTTDEGAHIAVQATIRKHLVPALDEARHHIENEEAALNVKLEVWNENLQEAKEQMDIWISKKEGFQDDLKVLTQAVRHKTLMLADNYLPERLAAWNTIWEQFSGRINLGAWQLLRALCSKRKREELSNESTAVCQKYLKDTLETFDQELFQNLQLDVEAFTSKAEIKTFVLNPADVRSQKTPQIPSGAGTLKSKNILSAFKNEHLELTFKRIVILALIPLGTFLIIRQIQSTRAGFVALPILIAAEAFYILGFNSNPPSRTLRDQLSEALKDAYAEYTSTLREDIPRILEERVVPRPTELLKTLEAEIESAETQVAKVLAERQKIVDDVESEKRHLSSIALRLDDKFNAINKIVSTNS